MQRTALLLSYHTDMLCELVHGVDRDDGAAAVTGLSMEATVSRAVHAPKRTIARSKRKRK